MHYYFTDCIILFASSDPIITPILRPAHSQVDLDNCIP
jgi:hypothetical protein